MNTQVLAPDGEEPNLPVMVTVRCGNRTWNTDKGKLCAKSSYFNAALMSGFAESAAGVIELNEIEPDSAAWLMEHIETGHFEIQQRDRTAVTKFMACCEVYILADYFGYQPLMTIALDTLNAEFKPKLGLMQQFDTMSTGADWLPELLTALALIYDGDVAGGLRLPSALRNAFLEFIHPVRFFLINQPSFAKFATDDCPAFGHDLFKAMIISKDFVVAQPDNKCCYCGRRPQNHANPDDRHYSHVAVQEPKLRSACARCARQRNLGSRLRDWCYKTFSTTAWGRRRGGQ